MSNELTYERPEVLEIGEAEELTLGQANKKYLDNCKCSWDGRAECEEVVL